MTKVVLAIVNKSEFIPFLLILLIRPSRSHRVGQRKGFWFVVGKAVLDHGGVIVGVVAHDHGVLEGEVGQ